MYLEGKGRVLAIGLDPFDHNQSHSVSSLEFTYIPGIEKIYKTYRKFNLVQVQPERSSNISKPKYICQVDPLKRPPGRLLVQNTSNSRYLGHTDPTAY